MFLIKKTSFIFSDSRPDIYTSYGIKCVDHDLIGRAAGLHINQSWTTDIQSDEVIEPTIQQALQMLTTRQKRIFFF